MHQSCQPRSRPAILQSHWLSVFIAVILLFSIQAVQAMPTVSGTTISWPDSGWYQVQSTADYSSVCEGGTSCQVPPGTYTVINHSTGERFENVVVSDTPAPSTDVVTVTGNTISWPDDGWYQVQSTSDYSSICEGGTSCIVSPGTYIVINHSTGQRFDGIVVSGEPGSPPAGDTPIVVGNIISWPDNGWYQVQSLPDYLSVCEGGLSCRVDAGEYVVINLTTGQRFEPVTVSGDGLVGPGNSTPTVSGSIISWPENGWYQVQSAMDFSAQCEGGQSCEVAAGTYIVINLTTGERFENIIVGEPTDPEPPVNPGTPDLIPAAALPVLDANNQISWAFDPVDSGLQIEIQPFASMPLASNGQPARWNDLEVLDDRIFVVDEQDGKVYEITNGQPQLWFDIKSAILTQTGRSLSTTNPFHGGVRGIAFHPNFADNGKFYASLLEERPADPFLHTYISDTSNIDADSVLVEWSVDPSTLEVDVTSYRDVFRVGIPQYDHPIKQILFNHRALPNDVDYGMLYIAHGDGSVESSTAGGGQGNNSLGKILRIDPLARGDQSYTVPADNPFTNDPSLPDEVYSYGHRNPHHLAFAADGHLITAEAGRDNLDEVNLVRRAGDYGWSEREGAYTHLEAGTLFNGISALPVDDALNGYVYPVAQFGHTGSVGSTFTGQALGGGFVVENGSPLDGRYFYIDFVKTGDFFYSKFSDMLEATTRGTPAELTVAKTWRANVSLDEDSNPNTPPIYNNLKEIVTSASGYVNVNDRVDVRIGQGPRGELYLMSKRNNMIYLVTSSLPGGIQDPGDGNEESVGTGRPTYDRGTHAVLPIGI